MTPTYSRQRQQAEIDFARAQSQFLARERPVEEFEAVARARAEKTAQLKTARIARDLNERARAAAALELRRTTKA